MFRLFIYSPMWPESKIPLSWSYARCSSLLTIIFPILPNVRLQHVYHLFPVFVLASRHWSWNNIPWKKYWKKNAFPTSCYLQWITPKLQSCNVLEQFIRKKFLVRIFQCQIRVSCALIYKQDYFTVLGLHFLIELSDIISKNNFRHSLTFITSIHPLFISFVSCGKNLNVFKRWRFFLHGE